MNLGYFIVEQERQEAFERAMVAHRARQAIREQQRRTGRKTGLGHGARKLSREQAVAMIAKKSPRGAWKLLAGYLNGVPTRRSN